MLGLLRKDLYLTAATARAYLIICLLFVVLMAVGVYDVTFLTTFLTLMCIMLPMNAFAYDEQAKWDKFSAALPTGREGAAKARYLFAGLVCLAAAVAAAALTLGAWLLGPREESLGAALLVGVLPSAFGCPLNAVLLPLSYRFGSQKGRIYLVLAIGGIMGAIFGVLGALSQAGAVPDLPDLLWALLPLCLLTLLPSCRLSMAILRKKEF